MVLLALVRAQAGSPAHLLEAPVLQENAILKDDHQLVVGTGGRGPHCPVLALMLDQRQPALLALLTGIRHRIYKVYKLGLLKLLK